MSAPAHQNRRRRPPNKIYMVSSDHKVQDHLEGTIRLQRGSLCQEQETGGDRGSRGGHLWVKVMDSGSVVKLDRQVLIEVPGELAGLLEPVTDLELRYKLLSRSTRPMRLAGLALGTPVLVRWDQTGEPAEAELRYRGPLTRGSTAVYFGVQLKGWAAGRGSSNGSYKGHQLFTCPENCALFVPVSELSQRSRGGTGDHDPPRSEPAEPGHAPSTAQSSGNHHPGTAVSILARAAESAPGPPQVGQRVCFTQDRGTYWGTVQYCAPLPGRNPSEVSVALLLDEPVGSWNGYYKNYKLCSIPSPEYGHLLPLSKVSAESRSELPPLPLSKIPQPVSPTQPPTRHPPQTSAGTHPTPTPLIDSAMLSVAKSALKAPSSSSSPPAPGVKVALKPPSVPVPVPVPVLKSALKAPPVPPSKPKPPALLPPADQPHTANGFHDPPSPAAPGRSQPGAWLEPGSMVEVNDPPMFGVIRWIGQISGLSEAVAGIELEQELTAGSDGSYLGDRHFRCPPNKGLFVKLRNCRWDSRFPAPEMPINQVERCNSIAFAEWGSKRVEENTPPVLGPEARQRYEGFKKGIQGHLNSCYLDASLFSLFSCCSSVDRVLFSPCNEDDHRSKKAQELLRCDIVNPLRRFGYVCASKTMALRKLLEEETTDAGFTNQEKDPEEFLNKLFQLLRIEPLLRIRSVSQEEAQECHLYQLFPPSAPPPPSSPLHSSVSPSASPPRSPIPLSSPALTRVSSVQVLLESSFMHSGLKFSEAPSCLLLLMPRFGKEFKMFDAILPSLTLDVTDLLDETLRQCSICQSVAEWECVQCYDDVDITPGQLKQYCNTCNAQVHAHKKRQTHRPVRVRMPKGSWEGPVHGARQILTLFAVTCIETSHYVSFVKHGPLPTDWLFFDSMADREGGENGFNVPQVRACPEVGRYLSLSEAELRRLDSASLREPVRRLLCDSYMCLYHCPELSLYK
ncbi:ubiquitin carboxyl-terminal hydrolase CYLD [Trichomycterus rosablanca]|uniref:ubiquitin carboxyl-terminal hydrolase CYLD n=1 Tax=Trichomycterus rosablanca TaxID=2290929 RepID=UPI002F34FC55